MTSCSAFENLAPGFRGIRRRCCPGSMSRRALWGRVCRSGSGSPSPDASWINFRITSGPLLATANWRRARSGRVWTRRAFTAYPTSPPSSTSTGSASEAPPSTSGKRTSIGIESRPSVVERLSSMDTIRSRSTRRCNRLTRPPASRRSSSPAPSKARASARSRTKRIGTGKPYRPTWKRAPLLSSVASATFASTAPSRSQERQHSPTARST